MAPQPKLRPGALAPGPVRPHGPARMVGDGRTHPAPDGGIRAARHLAEWAIWDARSGWHADAQTDGMGSYNAIRTYLWTGLSRNDPAFERLALAFLPWLHWVGQNGHAPEALNAATGVSTEQTPREGPAGFDVAALVLADSLGFTTLKRHLQTRIDASLSRQSPGYYSHALALFGLGWMEGRYRFTPQGALLLPDSACEPRGR